jgi:hypothetical protein
MPLKPGDNEYAEYYGPYVALVAESDILGALAGQPDDLAQLVSRVRPGRESYRYAEGKWGIREVIGHLIDAERVFGFRAFCFSRGEQAPLPGFDENDYVRQSHYDARPLNELMAEFRTVRQGNIAFLRGLNEKEWAQLGTASTKLVSVRALAYIMVGHARHHGNVLRDRYAEAFEPMKKSAK